MEFYFGADWRSTVKPTLAAKKYTNRILEVARDDSNLLIAHQYTRCRSAEAKLEEDMLAAGLLRKQRQPGYTAP